MGGPTTAVTGRTAGGSAATILDAAGAAGEGSRMGDCSSAVIMLFTALIASHEDDAEFDNRDAEGGATTGAVDSGTSEVVRD